MKNGGERRAVIRAAEIRGHANSNRIFESREMELEQILRE
jgi:hypothetical protein